MTVVACRSNVEPIDGNLMVQHYVEDIAEKHHVRLVSTSDVMTPTGRTKSGVICELTVKALGQDQFELSKVFGLSRSLISERLLVGRGCRVKIEFCGTYCFQVLMYGRDDN